MRHAYAHEAVLDLAPGSDERGPGGAVTVALCGSLDHPPPCPHAPHQTSVSQDGDHLAARIVFATDDEETTRRDIEAALEAGGFTGPDGEVSRWTVLTSVASPLTDEERTLADRLLVS